MAEAPDGTLTRDGVTWSYNVCGGDRSGSDERAQCGRVLSGFSDRSGPSAPRASR